MFSILEPICKYLKVKPIRIYDGIFGLHSQVTVAFLIACTLIVSAKEYFGKPIYCMSDEKDKAFVSSYCWVYGTYIIDNFGHKIGERAASIGVGPEKIGSQRIYQYYYPWIVLFLILQTILFKTPAYLWKIWEGGRMVQLCDHLSTVFVPDEWNSSRKGLLVGYFTNNQKDVHLFYAVKYFFCEFLNCIICILNMALLNWFFSGFWYNFGPAIESVAHLNWKEWNALSSRVFPKTAKCDFLKFGSSGSIQAVDALCILPLNILNEKLFAFMYCWLIFLTFISVVNVLYRIFVISSQKYRMWLLRAQVGCMSLKHTKAILGNSNIGDWFVLYQVSRNINAGLFCELMEQIHRAKKSSTISS